MPSSSVDSNLLHSPPKARRQSILDYGGINSLNNFASSYARAQSYTGSHILESTGDGGSWLDDLSPNTSPRLNAVEDEDEDPSIMDVLGDGNLHFRDNIHTFEFPPTETSNLLPVRTSGSTKSSVFGAIGNFGTSTAPQTVFNSINTLMGMAMLSLPFGLKLSGWVVGTAIFAASYAATNYTAIGLGRILKKHPHLQSYSDIANHCGGPLFSAVVTGVFTIDLVGASMSLIIIFSDSFHLIFPSIHMQVFKMILIACVFVLTLLPLSILSLFSLVGIFSTAGVLVVVVVCGLVSSSSPGSLLVPATTNIWPENWANVLLSLGIFMAPWGGHPVFPELYRDMRHPKKYASCSKISFGITFLMDYFLAAIGFLMFGIACNDSIIKSLMSNPEYPVWVKPVLSTLTGSLAVSKLPLIVKPLITVYEALLNFNIKNATPLQSAKRVLARAIFCSVLLCVSLLFNSFGKMVSFLGSAICYSICLALPLSFYGFVFKDEISRLHRIILNIGVAISVGCAVVGTYSSVTMDI